MEKIFFIRANSTKTGGAEVYLSRLVQALLEKGIECEIINSGLPKYLPSWLRVILFNWSVCRKKRGRFYFSLERISCPDVYRAGDGVHKVFLRGGGKSAFNPLHKVYLHLESQCFRNAKRIIANSKMIKNQIISEYKVNPEKIAVIYNGVNCLEVDQKKAYKSLSSEFGDCEKAKIILYVGSGFKRKGVEPFLNILAELMDLNFKAFVVGKEKNINHYIKVADNLGILNNVVFTGARLDVNYFYAVSDIFILPTSYEPFSNVILEAMSYKTAVFTTCQNGASEILDDEYVMNEPNDKSIVKVIRNLLNNEDELNKIKTDNYRLAGELDMEENVRKTLIALRGLL